jgi:hypothetical protein
LADLVTPIASPALNGSLRIRLPDAVKPGPYYLKVLNGHGEFAAQNNAFYVSEDFVFSVFLVFSAAAAD